MAPSSDLHVFLNPAANRGRAETAWSMVEPELRQARHAFKVWRSHDRNEMMGHVRTALLEGAGNLVAAGGDGTLQTVLDAYMTTSCDTEVAIGSIGIGTSNDFHKPLDTAPKMAGFPVRISEERMIDHDVHELKADLPNGETVTRHFLQSSHLGVIPTANHRLTTGGGFFTWLYRQHYQLALGLTAAYTIYSYQGFQAEVRCGSESWSGRFSGMSLLKRPNVAGNFSFKTKRQPTDGKLDFALLTKVAPMRLLELTQGFITSGFEGHQEVTFRDAQEVEATFAEPQPVDFDGELLLVTKARWRVIPDAVALLG